MVNFIMDVYACWFMLESTCTRRSAANAKGSRCKMSILYTTRRRKRGRDRKSSFQGLDKTGGYWRSYGQGVRRARAKPPLCTSSSLLETYTHTLSHTRSIGGGGQVRRHAKHAFMFPILFERMFTCSTDPIRSYLLLPNPGHIDPTLPWPLFGQSPS